MVFIPGIGAVPFVRLLAEVYISMRVWRKYNLDPASRGTISKDKDRTYEDHVRSMGGYDVDCAYNSREEFFDRHFRGASWGRFEVYDRFVRKVVTRGQRILSIASGRGVNELALIGDGYDVTCSDLELPSCLEKTKRLFPGLRYERINILNGPAPERYDAVLVLSLIYLFDESMLRRFFRNVAASLRDGGSLVLDSAGAPDNGFSFVWREVYLPLETRVKQVVRFLCQGRQQGVVVQKFGYVRSDEEIVRSAQREGLRLVASVRGGFLTEFRRSSLMGRIIGRFRWVDGVFSAVGRGFPYIRLFHFIKVSGNGSVQSGDVEKEGQ